MLIPLLPFTLLHTVLSIVGIIAGLIVVGGFMSGTRFDGWTRTFFATTLLTNISGFLFPFTTLLPSHILGGLSLVVLPIAMWARYGKQMDGGWRKVFVIGTVVALYFNVFVLFAQLFTKVPAMRALAPTPAAPAFGGTQLLVLVIFVILGREAVRGFIGEHRAAVPAARAA